MLGDEKICRRDNNLPLRTLKTYVVNINYD